MVQRGLFKGKRSWESFMMKKNNVKKIKQKSNNNKKSKKHILNLKEKIKDKLKRV